MKKVSIVECHGVAVNQFMESESCKQVQESRSDR